MEFLEDNFWQLLDGLNSGSPKPGRVQRTTHLKDEKDTLPEDSVINKRFLKINVRHITDGQGVVGGVLLVTPNAVMFDPNVSDALVIEHGPEKYGVIAPMELVVNAAIFRDIAHMRVAGGKDTNKEEHVEIYYPKQDTLSKIDKVDERTINLVSENPESSLKESVADINENEDSAKNVQIISSSDSVIEEKQEKQILTDSLQLQSDTSEKYKKSNTMDDERKSDLIDNTETSSTSLSNEIVGEALNPVLEHFSKPTPEGTKFANITAFDDQCKSQLSLPYDTDKISQPDDEKPDTKNTDKSDLHQKNFDTGQGNPALIRQKTSSVNFSIESNDHTQNDDKPGDHNKKNKMFKRLSYPLTWVEGLTNEGGKVNTEYSPNSYSNQSVFSKVFSSSPITLVSELGGNFFLSKTPSEDSGSHVNQPVVPHSADDLVPGRSSIGSFMRPHSSDVSTNKPARASAPKVDYRSMVSIDDMPELFVSFEKLLPRPARSCPDPPLYLRLRMGRPIGKSIPLPTSVMSYGKNKLKPEYWFSIPKNKVDELYSFIQVWIPHLYGELEEEEITSRGFELIRYDTEWAEESDGKDTEDRDDNSAKEFSKDSWEALKKEEDEFSKAFTTSPPTIEFSIPELIGKSEILTEDYREKLCAHLPARAEGYSWTLVFSTSQHGFSLNSLYRKMQKLESPVLLVIEDTDNNVFGALTSCAVHVSDHFYGTGESLLYKFHPTFKVFHWSGENLYFIKGNQESLSIGAGDGKFGLWLDGDLNQGRTQACNTYSNEPLAPQEDFVINTLECWAFI